MADAPSRGIPGLSAPTRSVLLQLSHPVTVEVLLLLIPRALDVTSLSLQLELDTSFVSRHLRRLRQCHLVLCTVNKRHHFYRVSDYVSLEVVDGTSLLQIATPSGDILRLIVDRATPTAPAPAPIFTNLERKDSTIKAI